MKTPNDRFLILQCMYEHPKLTIGEYATAYNKTIHWIVKTLGLAPGYDRPNDSLGYAFIMSRLPSERRMTFLDDLPFPPESKHLALIALCVLGDQIDAA